MKIDLTQTFTDQEGKTIQDKKGDLTSGKAITEVLLNQLQGDDKITGEEKAQYWTIWFDKIKDQKEAKLTVEEAATIKERIGRGWPQLIVGPMFKLLDNS